MPRNAKKRMTAFFSMVAIAAALVVVECFLYVPASIKIYSGETVSARNGAPYTLQASAEATATDAGFSADVKLFGILPVKQVHVDVLPKTAVVPLGNTVGIRLFTKGLMCVGTEPLEAANGKKANIAKEAGFQSADMLLSANGKELHTTEQLAQIVAESAGTPISFLVERDGKTHTRTITPLKTKDGFQLGIWVRDSTAGIGTVTYYDTQTNSFGALGHPITDVDTGALMPVAQGGLTGAKIVDVKKGKRGEPGELCGVFDQSGSSRGAILQNTRRGIFGVLATDFANTLPKETVLLASKSQVRPGKAEIYADVTGQGASCYRVEIVKVMKNAGDDKNMVIRVTDKKLLDITGGIVQGMSGSPIIQNGKLVGAVTHVFVNDPTRGYGIFIENMLSKKEQ